MDREGRKSSLAWQTIIRRGAMRGQNVRLTVQQEQFVKLVVEEGYTLVGAYRRVYLPRNGERSAQAERVAARRVAHHPLVEQRMEELRKQLRAGDPAELRRRANAVLGRILAQELDTRYYRVAVGILRHLDAQERAIEKAGQASLRTALDQLKLLDALDGRGCRGRSPVRRRVEETPQEAWPRASKIVARSARPPPPRFRLRQRGGSSRPGLIDLPSLNSRSPVWQRCCQSVQAGTTSINVRTKVLIDPALAQVPYGRGTYIGGEAAPEAEHRQTEDQRFGNGSPRSRSSES